MFCMFRMLLYFIIIYRIFFFCTPMHRFTSFRAYVQCWKYVSTGTNCMYDLHADRLHEHFPLDIHATSGGTICYLKLIALVGHLIRLSIVSLQIGADNCITDSLTIYDSLMPIKHKILYR